MISRKLSLAASSTRIRAARSARAHTTAESVVTSPDAMPCVMRGRSAARLKYGRATPPSNVSAPAALADASSRRRESIAPPPSFAMGPPPPCLAAAMRDSFYGGPTITRRADDKKIRGPFRVRDQSGALASIDPEGTQPTQHHPTLGSSLVDHSAESFQSFSVMVITSDVPSIAT